MMEMLPDPGPHQEVKHKVQILDYAIKNFVELQKDIDEMEMTLALRSNRHTLKWIDSFAKNEQDTTSVLVPFLQLFCAKKGWVYAEVWRPVAREAGESTGRPRDMLIEYCMVNESPWLSQHDFQKLKQLGDHTVKSQTVVKRSDKQTEVAYKSLRPYVVHGQQGGVTDPHRARTYAQAGIRSSMLVPVLINSTVAKMVAFYDTRDHEVDSETCRLATFIATNIGNAYNAANYERRMQQQATAQGSTGRGGASSSRAGAGRSGASRSTRN